MSPHSGNHLHHRRQQDHPGPIQQRRGAVKPVLVRLPTFNPLCWYRISLLPKLRCQPPHPLQERKLRNGTCLRKKIKTTLLHAFLGSVALDDRNESRGTGVPLVKSPLWRSTTGKDTKRLTRSDVLCSHAASAAPATSLRKTSSITIKRVIVARIANETSTTKLQGKSFRPALAGVVAFAHTSAVTGRNDVTISRSILKAEVPWPNGTTATSSSLFCSGRRFEQSGTGFCTPSLNSGRILAGINAIPAEARDTLRATHSRTCKTCSSTTNLVIMPLSWPNWLFVRLLSQLVRHRHPARITRTTILRLYSL